MAFGKKKEGRLRSLVLAGKKLALPHSEYGSRPLFFDEDGYAYVFSAKDAKGGGRSQVKESPTQAEVEAALQNYAVGFGLEVV